MYICVKYNEIAIHTIFIWYLLDGSIVWHTYMAADKIADIRKCHLRGFWPGWLSIPQCWDGLARHLPWKSWQTPKNKLSKLSSPYALLNVRNSECVTINVNFLMSRLP